MVLSWFLPVVLAASFAGILAAIIAGSTEQLELGFVVAFIAFPVSVVAMLAVTLFNLAWPSRGVADLLCGTMLMRK